jgi:hypothetical protein
MEFYYTHYVPYSYQYPDLGMIIEAESSISPPPRQKQWIYLIGALATLGLASFGLLANIPNLQEANLEVQQEIYIDYVSLTNGIR